MQSIWQAETSMPEFPPLRGDVKTEVLIIGGGITGILTAYFLQKQGTPYILVEKDRLCGGTTGKTTAKITYQHGLIYSRLFNSLGGEKARAYLEANKKAFEALSELCKKIPCDHEIKDNYVYSLNRRSVLEKEMAALDKIGYRAKLCSDIPLPFANAGAVCFPKQAQFNPLKFLAGISKDLNIFEHTFVREMQGNTAVTDMSRIRAEKVIAATHFPFINKHGSYFLKLYQHRSYMLALENAPDLHGMYVDEDKKGMTFRNYGNYLILGGGGARTGKNCGGWETLRRFAKEKYPVSKEKYHWAAQDCMSLDGMPYIGQYSSRTAGFYTACGFNKWGMTGSMLAAMLLSDAAADNYNVYAKLFSPSRSIFTPQLFANSFEAAANLISPSKKRCPHLGCALKWNAAEHSWDCPCHGSRFSKDGKVLDNPANGNLR